MIYLSASSISDFLACSQRYKFRIFDSSLADRTSGDTSQSIGSAVHKIIEKAWKKYDKKLVSEVLTEFNISKDSAKEKVNICLNNFYSTISPMLSQKDLREYSFKIKYSSDIYIVGRVDLITEDGIVFDWKTGFEIPETINNNIQFILYHWAYKKLYNKLPKDVYYVSLTKNKLVRFSVDKFYYTELIDNIIPKISTSVKESNFYKEGIFKGICGKCAFQKVCIKEGRI